MTTRCSAPCAGYSCGRDSPGLSGYRDHRLTRTVIPLMLPPCGVRFGKAERPFESVSIDQFLQTRLVVMRKSLLACPVVINFSKFEISARTLSAVGPKDVPTDRPEGGIGVLVRWRQSPRASRPEPPVGVNRTRCR